MYFFCLDSRELNLRDKRLNGLVIEKNKLVKVSLLMSRAVVALRQLRAISNADIVNISTQAPIITILAGSLAIATVDAPSPSHMDSSPVARIDRGLWRMNFSVNR